VLKGILGLRSDGVLLRVFIGESGREPGRDRPLYEAIVERARAAHLAGATVLRGPMGLRPPLADARGEAAGAVGRPADRGRDRGRGRLSRTRLTIGLR